MKKTVLFLLLILIFAQTAFAAPKNIISLSPVGTEILFALGQGDKITGVTKYCDYPPQAKKKPRVTNYFDGLNPEALITRKVDLVVVSDIQELTIPRLQKLGIKYVVVKQATITDIFDSILAVGKLCGAEKKAQALVAQIQSELNEIRQKTAKYPKPSVVISVSRELSEPAVRGFYAAGNATFYNNLLEAAGGKNSVKSRYSNYARISQEGLVSLNPQVIFDIVGDKTSYHDDLKEADLNKLFDKKKLKRQWMSSNVTAAKTGQIYIFDGTVFLRPGPRMAEIARAFARALHPEIKWQ